MRFPFPAEEMVEPSENAAIEETASSIVVLTANMAEEPMTSTATALNPQPGKPPAETLTALTVLIDDPKIEQSNCAAETVDLVLEPVPEPEPYVDLTPRPRPKRKVIAFPKQLSVAPESVYRLADPVTSEVPRILDVPEELQAIPDDSFPGWTGTRRGQVCRMNGAIGNTWSFPSGRHEFRNAYWRESSMD